MSVIRWPDGETKTIRNKRQALCSWSCRRLFGGASGFDKHRRGSECVDPAKVGPLLKDGVWVGKVDPNVFTKHSPAADSKGVKHGGSGEGGTQ